MNLILNVHARYSALFSIFIFKNTYVYAVVLSIVAYNNRKFVKYIYELLHTHVHPSTLAIIPVQCKCTCINRMFEQVHHFLYFVAAGTVF